MSEQTYVMVKPDGVNRGLIGEVIRRIEQKGYHITKLKLLTASKEQLDLHYAEHTEKPFYPDLVAYMLSGPVVAMVVEGDNVIKGIRALAGATMPTDALPGTIRGDFARDFATGAVQNIIHSSDATDSAKREIAIWFK